MIIPMDKGLCANVCHLKERRKISIYPHWSIWRLVRLRSDICSRNLFILFLVFMVCEIEEKKKAEEHGIQPAKEQYRPSNDCSSSKDISFSVAFAISLFHPSLSHPSARHLFPSNVYSSSPNERASSDCKLVRDLQKEESCVPF